MKKGFTLIELLTVIVILAIIALIVTPLVLNIIKASSKGVMQSDARILLSAVERKKLLDRDFNPMTYNDDLEGLLTAIGINSNNYDDIYFTYDGKTLLVSITGKNKYDGLTACGSYNEINVTEGTCKLDNTPPVVTLKGEKEVEIERGKTYTDLGVTVTDNMDLNPNVVVTGSVNTSVIGEYILTYTVTDASGNATVVTRKVTVVPPPDILPPTVTLNGTSPIEVEQGSTYTDLGVTATDNMDPSPITVVTGTVNTSVVGDYTLTYTVTDATGNYTVVTRLVKVMPPSYDGPKYITSKGVNGPVLATGMVPIKWNGSAWVDTDKYDVNWYDYATGSKKWANVRTADGSMWVWIPRYAYKITSNYHSSTNGAISVKFLKNNTNVASDATTVIESYDSQNNYVKHPAFNFGGTEITGIWVAKFEPSGTTASLNFKPGVVALASININTMFTASRNMETNNKYGWGLTSGLQAGGVFTTDTNNLDTHMAKNIEWGAIAYLSISTYGINNKITINSSSTFYTGGGTGTAYVSNTSQSTSNNIYGIYDIAGGSWEFVMANYDNTAGSSGLTPATINDKYIDRYSSTNNGYSTAKYGDAMYETSYNPYFSSGNNYGSWFTNYAIVPNTTYPWFSRGDFYNNSSGGAFTYNRETGASNYSATFRVIIVVGTGF